MKRKKDDYEISIKCGTGADNSEKLEMLCREQAEKMLETIDIPNDYEVSIPFWTSDIPAELICVGKFRRDATGAIVYKLDFSVTTA